MVDMYEMSDELEFLRPPGVGRVRFDDGRREGRAGGVPLAEEESREGNGGGSTRPSPGPGAGRSPFSMSVVVRRGSGGSFSVEALTGRGGITGAVSFWGCCGDGDGVVVVVVVMVAALTGGGGGGGRFPAVEGGA